MLTGFKEQLSKLRIVLGSKSQPRRQLLIDAGLEFTCEDSGFEEDLDKKTFSDPKLYVRATAEGKLNKLLEKKDQLDFNILITCDSVVVGLDGTIIEKPESKEHHREMMRAFSDSQHDIVSWVFVAFRKGDQITVKETHGITRMVFGRIPEESIERMIEVTPQLMGAAGGYQVQTVSNSLVKEMRGSCTSCIGLPMYELSELILEAIKLGQV